nr:MAG TPA: holin [Caudoviricetes sp.]
MFQYTNQEAAGLSLADKRRLVNGKIEQLDKQASALYFWVKCLLVLGVLSHSFWGFMFCAAVAYPMTERAHKLEIEIDRLRKQFDFLM